MATLVKGLVVLLLAAGIARAASLTDDGRVGIVADSQGMTAIKPLNAERWTPICGHLLLKPGDWVRTDEHGANALQLRLTGETGLVLGPGTLVEIVKPGEVRWFAAI